MVNKQQKLVIFWKTKQRSQATVWGLRLDGKFIRCLSIIMSVSLWKIWKKIFQKSKCTHVSSINLKGKVSDSKNIFRALIYFCSSIHVWDTLYDHYAYFFHIRIITLYLKMTQLQRSNDFLVLTMHKLSNNKAPPPWYQKDCQILKFFPLFS